MVNDKVLGLVERVLRGDDTAREELCREKAKGVMFAAMNILKNKADAEDVAQEVLLKVYQGIDRLKNPEYFEVWLYRILLNECTNIRRKARKMDYRGDEYAQELKEERIEFLPQEYAEDSEKRSQLMAIIQGLSPKYKQAVLMHYFDGMSYAQIGMVLGVSVSQVGIILLRSRKKIRKELEKKGAGTLPKVESFAFVPVLSQAMTNSADEIFSDQSVDKIISACKAADIKAATVVPYRTVISGKTVAAFVAAAAMCALAVLPFLQGNNAALTNNSPTASDTVKVVANVPQTSETQNAAAEVVEIEDITSPGAGMPPAQEGVIFEIQGKLQGGVKLKDKNHNIVEGGEKYLTGLSVFVNDDKGKTLEQMTTDENGRFSFEGENGIYYISLDLSGTSFVMAERSINSLIEPDVAIDDANGEVTIFVQKGYSPDFSIDFGSAACECGHVNPQSAKVVFDDYPAPRFDWMIIDAVGEIAAEGTGTEVSGELGQLLSEGSFGTYTLKWQAEDISGNTTVIRRDFKIVPEPVDSNQYR